ncbi:hypothetical protein AeMF1_007178 [Aphanomyces euteiches]|nr:hypothetical protein AeMF1_007178 [Aphanomyces euteiches]
MITTVDFTKRFCSCAGPLFSKKYLRPHRTNGSKVLRCFPHCCPEHTESPFCASSLAVSVTGSLELIEKCRVFLRFEASYEPGVVCGGFVDALAIEQSLRSESNPRGEWIPTQPVAVENDQVIFEFRAQADGGWNYRWLGGSSTQQRRCWHYIKAYVCYPFNRPGRLRVIAVVRSPPFVVMSYRRACKSCQKKSNAEPILSATHREACECEGMYRLTDSALDDIISSGTTERIILPDLGSTIHTIQDRNPREKEYHLAALYMTLKFAAISPAVAEELSIVANKLTGTGNKEIWLPIATASSSSPHEMQCLDIFLALFRSRNSLDVLLTKNAQAILDQNRLHEVYEEWLSVAYDTIVYSALRAKDSAPESYFTALLHAHRAVNPTLFTDNQVVSVGFEAFVAQLREIYLALSYRPPEIPSPDSTLDGLWICALDACQVELCSLSPSLLTVLRGLSMGMRFHLRLSSKSSLFIRSDIALFSTIWSEFILDGAPRVLRVFPNGESTMTACGGHMYGDYVGLNQYPGPVQICLYCWPTEHEKNRTCYILQVVFQPVKHTMLVCHVQVATSRSLIEQHAWNMSAAERIASFDQHDSTVVMKISATYQRGA